ncbi:MAG: LysR family transcriptional regulator [Opitutales bacterium]|nr:LysR family transcriptional regulator [Opitutales bacterium]
MEFEELFQRGLSLEKLRSFLAVVRAGSVTGAAGGEGSRRSLMSRQIGELEKTLGFELFQRKGKSLHITSHGRELALLCASFFDEVGAVATRVHEGSTNLRIGAGASILEAVVFPKIDTLRKRLDGYCFEFITDHTAGLLRSLREGTLDMGIVRSGEDLGDLITKPCGMMDFVFVGRLDFDRNLPTWTPRQFLSRVPLALIRGEGRFVSAFNSLCEAFEVSPRITTKTESFGQVRQILLHGHPGGILPRSLAQSLPESAFFLFDDPLLRGLDRKLVLGIDRRAARLRDRLNSLGTTFAEILRA